MALVAYSEVLHAFKSAMLFFAVFRMTLRIEARMLARAALVAPAPNAEQPWFNDDWVCRSQNEVRPKDQCQTSEDQRVQHDFIRSESHEKTIFESAVIVGANIIIAFV